MKKIFEISNEMGWKDTELIPYGYYKAKLNVELIQKNKGKSHKMGNLILVTAMSPTPFGEGKTTTR